MHCGQGAMVNASSCSCIALIFETAQAALVLTPHCVFPSRLDSRLGVGEVVMVDNDVVSASNLNRQVLYSGGDVGRRKVDAAIEGLDRDNLRTRTWGGGVC